jgi:hypothetical protein
MEEVTIVYKGQAMTSMWAAVCCKSDIYPYIKTGCTLPVVMSHVESPGAFATSEVVVVQLGDGELPMAASGEGTDLLQERFNERMQKNVQKWPLTSGALYRRRLIRVRDTLAQIMREPSDTLGEEEEIALSSGLSYGTSYQLNTEVVKPLVSAKQRLLLPKIGSVLKQVSMTPQTQGPELISLGQKWGSFVRVKEPESYIVNVASYTPKPPLPTQAPCSVQVETPRARFRALVSATAIKPPIAEEEKDDVTILRESLASWVARDRDE